MNNVIIKTEEQDKLQEECKRDEDKDKKMKEKLLKSLMQC